MVRTIVRGVFWSSIILGIMVGADLLGRFLY
jgi:hypothetical protein